MIRIYKDQNLAIYPIIRNYWNQNFNLDLSDVISCQLFPIQYDLLKVPFLGKVLLRSYLLDNKHHNHNEL